MTTRLWGACGLPDFRKTGAEQHSRLVGRIFRHLSEGDHRIPAPWFADELQRLDTVQGDVETIAGRIAAVRTWAYIAHRADWLAEPAMWAERTRQLEEKLSDALHERLTQRFVDRRTSVLLRDLDKRGAEMLPVTIAADGLVSVADEPIGHLTGFRFVADVAARHADMKRLMAAAERRLGVELARRAAAALVADGDEAFTLATDIGRPVAIFWRGDVVARLGKGKSLTEPRLTLHRTLDPLSADDRAKVAARCEAWLQKAIARHLAPLAAISNCGARHRDRAGAARAARARRRSGRDRRARRGDRRAPRIVARPAPGRGPARAQDRHARPFRHRAAQARADALAARACSRRATAIRCPPSPSPAR